MVEGFEVGQTPEGQTGPGSRTQAPASCASMQCPLEALATAGKVRTQEAEGAQEGQGGDRLGRGQLGKARQLVRATRGTG